MLDGNLRAIIMPRSTEEEAIAKLGMRMIFQDRFIKSRFSYHQASKTRITRRATADHQTKGLGLTTLRSTECHVRRRTCADHDEAGRFANGVSKAFIVSKEDMQPREEERKKAQT